MNAVSTETIYALGLSGSGLFSSDYMDTPHFHRKWQLWYDTLYIDDTCDSTANISLWQWYQVDGQVAGWQTESWHTNPDTACPIHALSKRNARSVL